ncbi:MAG: hypothetical protein AB7R89_04300 [Dehalococcoidia bacterium]
MLSGTRRVSAGHIARLAAEFWSEAGGADDFPREPEPLITFHLPISVHPLPDLSCAVVSDWAARLGLPPLDDATDRPLRGCLLAYAGEAVLLLDGGDDRAQRRVTVAHELGHYLIEIREPRRRVVHALGGDALAVLDGVRPATFDERLNAALAGTPLGVHVHLMTREEDGSIACARVAAAECAADDFALELLAPRSSLRTEVLALAGQPLQQRWALASGLLIDRYDLPPIIAGGYAKELVHDLTGDESVRERLDL